MHNLIHLLSLYKYQFDDNNLKYGVTDLLNQKQNILKLIFCEVVKLLRKYKKFLHDQVLYKQIKHHNELKYGILNENLLNIGYETVFHKCFAEHKQKLLYLVVRYIIYLLLNIEHILLKLIQLIVFELG
jgi:hypothetical protein